MSPSAKIAVAKGKTLRTHVPNRSAAFRRSTLSLNHSGKANSGDQLASWRVRADWTGRLDTHCGPAWHAPLSLSSIGRRDDRPIGLVNRETRLRPPGSHGARKRSDHHRDRLGSTGKAALRAVIRTAWHNAFARRAYTARRGKDDVAMPVLRPCLRIARQVATTIGP